MIKETLDSLIAEAMKAKNNSKLKVLRLIKAEYQKFITSGKDKELDDNSELKILKKLQNQWKEELEAFKTAGRNIVDLTVELEYLESFLPKEMSEEQQKEYAQKIIDVYLKGLPIEERASMKYLGAIIKIVNKEYPFINGKLVSELYKKTIGI